MTTHRFPLTGPINLNVRIGHGVGAHRRPRTT